jgi:hypothetical protein
MNAILTSLPRGARVQFTYTAQTTRKGRTTKAGDTSIRSGYVDGFESGVLKLLPINTPEGIRSFSPVGIKNLVMS